MQKKDKVKNYLYENYCLVKDDHEKKWKKEDFYSFVSNKDNLFILSQPNSVGYLKARIIKDEIEIISILINKSFRKKGKGKALLNELLDIAKKKTN